MAGLPVLVFICRDGTLPSAPYGSVGAGDPAGCVTETGSPFVILNEVKNPYPQRRATGSEPGWICLWQIAFVPNAGRPMTAPTSETENIRQQRTPVRHGTRLDLPAANCIRSECRAANDRPYDGNGGQIARATVGTSGYADEQCSSLRAVILNSQLSILNSIAAFPKTLPRSAPGCQARWLCGAWNRRLRRRRRSWFSSTPNRWPCRRTVRSSPRPPRG